MADRLRNGLVVSLVSFLFLSSGCVPLLIGAGAAGGYALSNDSASGKVSSQYRVLWDLCISVLKDKEGEILAVNQARGYIKALVYEDAVSVRIDSIDKNTQKLRVTARRCYMPKPQFAQKIFFAITSRLKQ